MSLDRDQVLVWLNQFGDEDDANVLSAARALNSAVADAGADWDELLVSGDAENDDIIDEIDEIDEIDAEAAESLPPADNSALAALIDKILKRSDLYEGTRQEIEEFKAELESGTLDAGDAKYVQALARRLGLK
jgi:hypothetical protein